MNEQQLLDKAAEAHSAGRLSEAGELYSSVQEPSQAYPLAQFNLGVILLRTGQVAAGEGAFARAARRMPELYDVWIGLGEARAKQGKFTAAAAAYRKATQQDPDKPLGWARLSECLRFDKKYDEAIAAASRAVAADPEAENSLAQLLHAKMRACDWRDIKGLRQVLRTRVDEKLKAGEKTTLRPFLSIVALDDPAFHKRVADEAAMRTRARTLHHGFSTPAAKSADKLTIGYLSAGFGDHPTGHLARGLFAQHDRSRFRTLALSIGAPEAGPITREVQGGVDQYLDLHGASDLQAAGAIRQAGVDVLVDLHGFLQDNRINVAAMRPAPVSINYLGFPGGTGEGVHDYILADEIVIPAALREHYAEAVVWMDGGYQLNDPRDFLKPGPRPSKADHGLPEAPVFCCFNMSYKIDPEAFDTWCAVLKTLPEAVLWLFDGGAEVRRNLSAAAGERGVDPSRLIFGPPLKRADHIARLAAADVALDTLICGGHTTTTDCLLAGVPVVTRPGRAFPARVAASLLTNAGLADCVTDGPAAFVERAVALARSPDERNRIRDHLLTQGAETPLFDLPMRARVLERAYTEMHRRALAGEPPAPFLVRASQAGAGASTNRTAPI